MQTMYDYGISFKNDWPLDCSQRCSQPLDPKLSMLPTVCLLPWSCYVSLHLELIATEGLDG